MTSTQTDAVSPRTCHFVDLRQDRNEHILYIILFNSAQVTSVYVMAWMAGVQMGYGHSGSKRSTVGGRVIAVLNWCCSALCYLYSSL